MKKRIAIIFSIILAFALGLGACSGTDRNPAPGAKQETDYVVLSNGGSVVQYGNYVYFINGNGGFDGFTGSNNAATIEKGGLYRAELNKGTTGGKTKQEFNFYYSPEQAISLNTFRSVAAANGLEFTYTADVEIFEGYETQTEEEIAAEADKIKRVRHEDVINVELIVPRIIGTSGYDNGGIFIYDNHIYYASPNDTRDKAGNWQYAKTDFYKTTLDGSKTERIYTTKKDSATSDYTFYKQNGSVYLVVKDGTDLISVKDDKKMEARKIAENVSSCYLPTKTTYYNYTEGSTTYKSYENGVEDFVYYIRPATDSDAVSGNVLEVMRPSGEERFIIHSDRGTMSILGSDNGVLFYKVPSLTLGSKIIYTNLHNILLQKSASYKSASENGQIKVNLIKGEFLENTDEFSSVKGIFPNATNMGSPANGSVTDVYLAAFSESGVSIISPTGTRSVFDAAASYAGFVDGKLYFMGDGSIHRIDMFNASAEVELVADDMDGSHTFMVDFIDGFIFYFGEYDVLAADYLRLKSLANISGDSKFIGYIIEDERLQEDEE